LEQEMSQSIMNPGANGQSTTLSLRRSPAGIFVLITAGLFLFFTYGPNVLDLIYTWSNDQNYSHGYLVIPIALVILFQRLANTPTEEPSPAVIPAPWWGWVFLAAVLAVRAIAYERNSQWVETATLVPAIACLTWTFGSWPLLKCAWPAIAFLVFMLPLPPVVNELVSLPLQRMAATGSCFLLQLSGLWTIQDGNVINISTPRGMVPMDVAAACSGLRMLMTMAATITATIVLIPLPLWKRITLLASAVPIALVSNMLRIVATGVCYYLFESEWARQKAHDWSGYLMMVVGMLLVGLELGILSWLVPSEDEPDDERAISPLLTDVGRIRSESITRLGPKKALTSRKSTHQDLDEV
jgi:exosortase